jgi:predicted transporter
LSATAATPWDQTGAPLVEGSSTQSGSLPSTPVCFLGGTQVTVAAALVSPGLYILNITIPNNAVAGDNLFDCIYNGTVVNLRIVKVFSAPDAENMGSIR